MKKALIIATALMMLFAVSNLFAQSIGVTGKGLKAGVNMAKYTGTDAADDLSMRTAFAFGGYVTLGMTDLFSVQPELLYSMKGAKWDYTDLSGTVNVTDRLSYIEIPVLFKVQLVGTPAFKPNFYVGPQFSMLLSAKEKSEASGQSAEADIKDNLKSTDFGLVGGVGANFPVGTGSLSLDIRYDLGLSKVIDAAPAPKINNSAITFLVGYGF